MISKGGHDKMSPIPKCATELKLSRSNDHEYLASSARYVRSLGIITFAVGVGEADIDELRVSLIRFLFSAKITLALEQLINSMTSELT